MVKPFHANKPELTIDETKVQSIDILPTLLYLACGADADFKDFEGFTPNNIPHERVRKVYSFYDDKTLPPVDPDIERCYAGCKGFEEYILDDPNSFHFGLKSKSFVRRIPLIVNSQKDK